MKTHMRDSWHGFQVWEKADGSHIFRGWTGKGYPIKESMSMRSPAELANQSGMLAEAMGRPKSLLLIQAVVGGSWQVAKDEENATLGR